MTVVLELKPEVEAALQKKALSSGFELSVYLERLVERDVERIKAFDDILAPIRKNFADSGMTEEELDELVERERQAVWDEKHDKRIGE